MLFIFLLGIEGMDFGEYGIFDMEIDKIKDWFLIMLINVIGKLK